MMNLKTYAVLVKMQFGVSPDTVRWVVFDSFDDIDEAKDYAKSNNLNDYKIYQNPGFILGEQEVTDMINNMSEEDKKKYIYDILPPRPEPVLIKEDNSQKLKI